MFTEKYRELLLPSGGYQRLKSFQLAQLVYDITVRFVELYIPQDSRTCDQMIQAARSGVQNIAEGSLASGTSKKTELKLTGVARASLEELKLDYEDFLRQNQLERWTKDDLRSADLISQRFENIDQLRQWINFQRKISRQKTNHSNTREIAANTALVLLRVASSLLERQLDRLASDFTQYGSFTERLYAVRKEYRK